MRVYSKKRFVKEVYNGDYALYKRERKADYCKVQFEWSCWLDNLCKSGEITQYQYDHAIF